MIPKVEDILVTELERRICEALGDMVASPDLDPESFTTAFETRKFTACIQEQANIVVFGVMESELSVIFYSQKERIDYTALYVSLARNPFIRLADGISAVVGLEKCEAVEGPYLCNDAWLIKARYHIFEIEDGQNHQPPRLGNSTTGAPDLYPRPAWDKRNEPEAVI